MLAADVELEPFNIGDTDRILFTVTKDGQPWDLTNATVTFVFEQPDRRTQFTRTAQVASNTCYYDTQTSDFSSTGWWTLTVHIVDGAVTKRYPHEIGFRVVDEP